MSRRYIAFVIAMLTVLMALSAGTGRASAAQQPVVTSVLLSFKGRAAEHLIAGKKGKRYSLSIYGAGFDSSSTVVLNEQPLPTQLTNSNQLTASLSGIKLTAGVRSLRVVNADGQASNVATLDVVTDPTLLAVTSISKTNGPIGTQLTLTGVGFASTGNLITFVRTAEPFEDGIAAEVDSPDGVSLTFNIPSLLCHCSPPCRAPCLQTAAAQYRVFVSNAIGTSTSAGLLVTPPDGPIGVWGAGTDRGFLGLKVTVTDSQIVVEGGCFGGLSTTTLTTDQSGNFNVAGFYAIEAGPVSLVSALRPAQFSGSISGNKMTLTITVADSLTEIGPFTLTFGDDVKVVHPCV